MSTHLSETRLPVHEWIAILVISSLLLLFALIGIGFGTPHIPSHVGAPHFPVNQEIEVFIEGAVAKSGTFRVKRGAVLSDLLELTPLTSEADMRRVKQDKRLRNGQVIKIPSIPKVSITIEGAVANAGTISLPKGSRLCDLIPHVQFLENANIEKLQRKRRLKEGETIHVTYKAK